MTLSATGERAELKGKNDKELRVMVGKIKIAKVNVSAGDAVSALLLRLVESVVGRVEQAFGGLGDVGQRRDADRRAELVARAAIGEEHVMRDAIAQAPGVDDVLKLPTCCVPVMK